MDTDFTPLRQAVARLDLPSADAVADLLRAEGIKGSNTGNAWKCPIANFLTREAPVPGLVINAGPIGLFYCDNETLLTVGPTLNVPPAASAFMLCFDNETHFQDLAEVPLDSDPCV
jgi:hypothetical protein